MKESVLENTVYNESWVREFKAKFGGRFMITSMLFEAYATASTAVA